MIEHSSKDLYLADGEYIVHLMRSVDCPPFIATNIAMISVKDHNDETDDLMGFLGLRATPWFITGITRMKDD